MRLWAASAVFVAVCMVPAWAQRHGGAGFSGHSAAGFHGAAVGRGAGLSGVPRFGPSYSNRFSSASGFGHTRFFYPRYRYPWAYPYIAAPYFYPGYYANYDYPAMSTSSYGASNDPSPYFDTTARVEQEEIDRLESEVDRLRDERESRTHSPPRPEAQPATVLIFNDKHTEEVQNYAIVGQTLWIFTELKARKILLADLDLPATTKANEDRGVDFRLPED